MLHRSPRRLLLPAALLLLLAGGALIGCGTSAAERDAPGLPFYSAPEDAFPADADEREAALAVLASARTGVLRTAYDRLDAYRYTVRRRTEQLDAAGAPIAARQRTVHYTEAGAVLLEQAAHGSFEFGFLGRLVSPDVTLDTATTNVGARMLPDDPAYRSPRHRAAYAYALHADTTRGGRPTRVVEVRARRGAGDDLLVRYARLTVDRATDALIGLTLVRVADGWLFEEASRFTLRLRPVSEACGRLNPCWVPRTLLVRTRLQLPLRSSRRFRTTAAYVDYAPAGRTAGE